MPILRRDASIYAAAWLALLAMYAAAFVANGIAPGFALRNSLASLLPDALLGLAILNLPSRLRWEGGRRGRFFAAHFIVLVAFLVLAAGGWMALVALDSVLFRAPL